LFIDIRLIVQVNLTIWKTAIPFQNYWFYTKRITFRSLQQEWFWHGFEFARGQRNRPDYQDYNKKIRLYNLFSVKISMIVPLTLSRLKYRQST